MQIPNSFNNVEEARAEANKVLRVANVCRSGSLQYSEWVISSANKHDTLSEENLRFAFDFFDNDKTGLVDYNKLT